MQHHVTAVGPPDPPAAWAAELGRFVTALRSEGAQASAADPATARLRLFEAASIFLADMAADGPAVAIFDDLHWADSDTLLLVEHLVRGAASAPILLVGTYHQTPTCGVATLYSPRSPASAGNSPTSATTSAVSIPTIWWR